MAYVCGVTAFGGRMRRGTVRCCGAGASEAKASVAGSTLSPRAMELVKLQMQQPIFDREQFGGMWKVAEDERRFLTNEELESLRGKVPVEAVKVLRDEVEEIVNDARTSLLQEFPGITEPGGALYPSFRSAACWRDFWHFTRVASYGVSIEQDSYMSKEGLSIMHDLYREVAVPLEAMIFGVEELSRQSQERANDEKQSEAIRLSFDVLIRSLKEF